MTKRQTIFGLSLIVVVYLAIGALYAVNTPAWQVPDEPAHYNYIRHIAQTGTLPVLQASDYDQAYLSRLTSEKFPPALSLDSVRYESWQPPLYYLLAAPVFVLFGGALLPLRLFSLLLGAGVIVFTFLTVRELSTYPRMTLVALVAAGFVAFIPQHIAMLAGVNNDSLSELLIALGLWLILREAPMRRGGWRLSLVIGLALVTKSQAYVLVPAAAVMLVLAWRRNGWSTWRLWFQRAFVIFGLAFAIGWLVWGRNLFVYGWPDFMGAINHDAVVKDQTRTFQWLAQFGGLEVALRFVVTTFQSFWGQFGWMGVVMDQRVYGVLLVYSLGLIGGFLFAARRHRRELTGLENEGSKVLLASALVTLALYLYYNLTFVQHQGRYLFPALVPLSALAAVSLWQWAQWIGTVLKTRNPKLEAVLMFLPIGLMAALDVFALYRFILPALAS